MASWLTGGAARSTVLNASGHKGGWTLRKKWLTYS